MDIYFNDLYLGECLEFSEEIYGMLYVKEIEHNSHKTIINCEFIQLETIINIYNIGEEELDKEYNNHELINSAIDDCHKVIESCNKIINKKTIEKNKPTKRKIIL